MKSESERVIRLIRKPRYTVIRGRETSLATEWRRVVRRIPGKNNWVASGGAFRGCAPTRFVALGSCDWLGWGQHSQANSPAVVGMLFV